MAKAYGNIKDGLSKAWKAMNNDWRTDKFLPPGCKKCVLKTICGGGCKAEAFAHNGKLSAPDPLTNFDRAFQSPPPIVSDSQPEITKKLYRFNPKVRFRKEAFGGMVMCSNNFIPLQKTLYKLLLKKFNKNKTLSLFSLSRCLKCSKEDAKDTMSHLLTKMVVY